MNKPDHRLGAIAPQSDQRLAECLGEAPGHAGTSCCAHLTESEWEGVAISAAKHGLQPLLYERLAAATLDVKVPEKILESLRESFLINSLQNSLLYQDLRGVLGVFRQRGIAVIVLKGAHLAGLVYQTIASRQMADIDILVEPSELTEAAATLLENGYSSAILPRDVEAWRLRHPNSHHLPAFAKPLHPRIEVHWTISAPSNPEAALNVWEESRSVCIAGVEARVLSPEDLLIHLCLHARLHRFGQGLRPVCDMSAAIRHYQGELDWNKVLTRTKTWHAEKCVHLGLWLGKKLMRAPVPDSILTALWPSGLEAPWAELAVEIVFAGTGVRPETEYALQLLDPRLRWGGATSLSGKLGLLGRKLFPGRDHMAEYMAQQHLLPLPPLRPYTCYLIRVLDLLGAGVRLVNQAARGRSSDTARRLRWNNWLHEVASW